MRFISTYSKPWERMWPENRLRQFSRGLKDTEKSVGWEREKARK